MEEKSTSTFKFSLLYGLYTGIGVIILSLIFYILDVSVVSPLIFWAPFGVYALGMLWAADVYKKNYNGGFLSYGKAFSVSYLVGMVATVIAIIYGFIFIEFIDPTVMDKVIEANEQKMIDQGMTDAQIDQGLEMTKRFTTPVFRVIFGLVVNGVILAVVSLLTSIFVKKEEGL